jgi:formate hydrogenlyase subunit 6/NADH:ubiquinone oxidoreductase subunit I
LIPLSKVAYPNNFRGITVDENCIGCGICAQICPMENIRIENGRAVIGDDCATCLSCFHFCPQEAIWMSRQENIARRSKYCHPDVTLRDILAQKEKI